MKYSLYIFFLLSFYKLSAQTKFIPSNSSNIVFIGRFDFSEPNKVTFMYSGCTIRTIFSGNSISIILKEQSPNYFTILVDNQVHILKTNPIDTIYTIAENLSENKHHLDIIRNTEWSTGNSIFKGFKINQDANIFKPTIQERKIEFIGDSYTCGYGIYGKSHDEHFSYDTEDNYISYGAITARNLQAEYTAVCRSGIGMLQGYGGTKNFTQPLLFDEIIQNSKASWNYASYQPQLIVIELGTNDLSVEVDSDKFIATYQQFIRKIRVYYPNAKIVCAAGPNPGGDKWILFQKMIHSVVNSINLANIYYFEFSNFTPNGSDWHPNAIEHQKMAKEFTAYVKNLMKW
ncbi:MAG: SGNH/GDSL hydrolase family protein [Bacteroidota bacterium]